jgi:hypothetical protein
MTYVPFYSILILFCFSHLNKLAEAANIKPVSWPVFLEVFDQLKLAVHQLKKDICDFCSKMDVKKAKKEDMTEEDKSLYDSHRAEVIAVRDEKNSDKKLDKQHNLVAVMDVQKVLSCPQLRNQSQYYMHKLSLKNWTVYNFHTRAVVCRLFDETQAGSDSHVFATVISAYIEEEVAANNDIDNIILWSDTSAAQNRNGVLANALLHLSVTLNINIFQKYYVSGHSFNEGDSAHSAIETNLKNRDVHTPEEFSELIRTARKKQPYIVTPLKYTDVNNYSGVNYYSSIRPSVGPGGSRVNQLRCLWYRPDGLIHYKLLMSDDWKELPSKLQNPQCAINKHYASAIPLSAAKYRDIQKLKAFMPTQCHSFYDSLCHL